MLWLVWPGIVLAILIVGTAASVVVQRGWVEVRLALTRLNLVMLAFTMVLPPGSVTLVWWRMHGRRLTHR